MVGFTPRHEQSFIEQPAGNVRPRRCVRARFDAEGMARAIADHVAGMTDRFAIEQHRTIFGREAMGPVADLLR